MKWSVALLALACLLPACGDGGAIPAEYLKIEVDAPEQVTTGAGFPLLVTRIWSKDLASQEIEADVLPPLHLKHQETIRRENDTHVMEVRHYLAYCFTTGEQEVYVPSLAASPVLGGSDLKVEANRITLTVNGTLDPDAPGDAEYPGPPLEQSRFWRRLLVAVGVAAIGIYLLRGRPRRAEVVTVAEPESAPPPLSEVTLAKLHRLRATSPEGREEVQAFYVSATAIIRRYLGERFSFDARDRTSEELELLPALRECRSGLRDFFGHADLVKFARHDPTPAEREWMMDSAESLVRETGAA